MVLGSPTEETEALVKFSNHGGRTKVNLGLAGFKASAYLLIWLHWSLWQHIGLNKILKLTYIYILLLLLVELFRI